MKRKKGELQNELLDLLNLLTQKNFKCIIFMYIYVFKLEVTM